VTVSAFIRDDARRAFDVLKAGGIAIIPMDVGYTCAGGSGAALQKIFDTKQRASSKRNAMVGDHAIARALYDLSPRGWDVIEAITGDHGLPLGAVGPCRINHPLLRVLDDQAIEASTKDGSLVMLLNAGPFHAEICRLSLAEMHPIFGSSANVSLQGTKFRVEDIEPEILAIADIVINHGLRKYHYCRQSSTLLNVETFEVARHGANFEIIADICQRRFGVTLTERAAAEKTA
jgi:tRNA A37 threonylcarbamoyladenosine synthetase subunit TsaC/SUA5/YrdC